MEPQTFELRTALLKDGTSHQIVAKTDLMAIAIKCYGKGGEHVLHCHPAEDHAFIILDGEVTFVDQDGKEIVLKKGHGILIPAGWYHWFYNSGGRPLVFLRVGATREKSAVSSLGIDGKPLTADPSQKVKPVPQDGREWIL
jgi:mannose-6-phosphate isomerase-like protein (cupin superfamily)